MRALTTLEEAIIDVITRRRDYWWPSQELISTVSHRIGHEKGKKTIRRAFDELESLGLIQRRGEYRQRQWICRVEGSKSKHALRPPVELALALLKLQQLDNRHLPASTMPTLDSWFESAARVLNESPVASHLVSARAWIGKTLRLDSGYPLIAPELSPGLLETLHRALYDDEILTVTYDSKANPEARTYEVMPLALIEKGPFWYAVAKKQRTQEEGEPFLLRLDRIRSIATTGKHFVRDPRFDLDDYIRTQKALDFFPQAQEPVVLRIREMPTVASPFRSVKIAQDQQIEETEDGFIVRATVKPSIAFRNLLLEYSPHLEVVEPAHLRQEISGLLESALSKYKKTELLPFSD